MRPQTDSEFCGASNQFIARFDRFELDADGVENFCVQNGVSAGHYGSGKILSHSVDAMPASSTCAVQMLLVALSRRMCCSRVCIERRYPGRPLVSCETPTRRPAMWRL